MYESIRFVQRRVFRFVTFSEVRALHVGTSANFMLQVLQAKLHRYWYLKKPNVQYHAHKIPPGAPSLGWAELSTVRPRRLARWAPWAAVGTAWPLLRCLEIRQRNVCSTNIYSVTITFTASVIVDVFATGRNSLVVRTQCFVLTSLPLHPDESNWQLNWSLQFTTVHLYEYAILSEISTFHFSRIH